MKSLIFILIFTFGFIGCGKDNSSGSDSTSNGVDSTIRYTQMATTAAEDKIMYGEFSNFALQITKDKKYELMEETRRGLITLMKGLWHVSGTNIVLDRAGTGSYLESTVNGVVSDCIYFQSANLSPEVKDHMFNAGLTESSLLQFCNRR